MSAIKDSFAKSLLRVSKRHSVADLVDHFKTDPEQEAIEKEREEFDTLKGIAEYCGMKLVQRVDANGNEQYVLLEKVGDDEWHGSSYFADLHNAKEYLISLKKRMDQDYEQQAMQAEHNSMVEQELDNWNVNQERKM